MFRAGCRCFAPPHERVPENIQSDILPKVNISRLTLRKPLTITHGSQLLQKKKKKKKIQGSADPDGRRLKAVLFLAVGLSEVGSDKG